MKVCDRCKAGDKPIVTKLKIKGKEYELCADCSECVGNYIQFSFQPAKGLAKLGEFFGG